MQSHTEVHEPVAANFSLDVNIHKGMILAAMTETLAKSSEKIMSIHSKPKLKVTVTKAFKTGSLMISALSPSVAILQDKAGKKATPPVNHLSLNW